VLAKRGGQERLDEVPGHGRSHSPAPHTNNVHVIVLNPLPGREVVVNDRGANAWDLVGTDRSAETTPADRHATPYLYRHHRPRQRDHEVRIVVARVQAMRPEIDDLMPRGAEMGEQLFLQTIATVIGGNTYTHVCFSTVCYVMG